MKKSVVCALALTSLLLTPAVALAGNTTYPEHSLQAQVAPEASFSYSLYWGLGQTGQYRTTSNTFTISTYRSSLPISGTQTTSTGSSVTVYYYLVDATTGAERNTLIKNPGSTSINTSFHYVYPGTYKLKMYFPTISGGTASAYGTITY